MSLADRISEVNNGSTEGKVAFWLDGAVMGWLDPARAQIVAGYDAVFSFDGARLRLHPELEAATVAERSQAVAPALQSMAARGLVSGWRDELFPIVRRFADSPSLLMERAAVAMFGARGFGVHINGLVRDDSGMRMWVARRAADKPTWPGLLDQMVAGGQPAGMGLHENVVKECAEEASVPAALARSACPAGAVSYCMRTGAGLRRDWLFVYDLFLPADFEPLNADGEVAGFELWPMERVLQTVGDEQVFKPNCALVAIDCLLRHGHIDPEHDDFEAIASGLHHSV